MYIIASRTCVCGELGELEARSCVRGETRARCRTARRRAQAERGQPGGIRTRRCWSGTLHIDIFSHQNQEEESIASVKTDYIMGLTNLTVDWQWQSVCSAVWNMLATNTMEHSGKEHRGTHSETHSGAHECSEFLFDGCCTAAETWASNDGLCGRAETVNSGCCCSNRRNPFTCGSHMRVSYESLIMSAMRHSRANTFDCLA